MDALSGDEVRRRRARAQGLHGDGGGRTVADTALLAGGLQAQDAKACRLQVRARSTGLTAPDVDAACAGRPPSVVRTWLMRGTLHAVAAEDVRWLTALLGPRAADAYWGRRARLGLDEDLCARALTALERVLPGQALGRDVLVARLAGEGVVVDPGGQAPAHLLLYAAAHGVVCRGPEAEGDAATYVLADEWLDGVAGRRTPRPRPARSARCSGPAPGDGTPWRPGPGDRRPAAPCPPRFARRRRRAGPGPVRA
ncbi:DNA glycosylase AlkZ-like family protein, partial [Actinacidiphila rubida]|uniref:DNA glycosylase AlkZ-like family protein n=1 Tax=Actinacidiphila rubida TaxID=310780 RepID=UPI00114D1E6F